MIFPGSTIGILGGGQLGWMLAFEAKCMGYEVWTLDPTPISPTGMGFDGALWLRTDCHPSFNQPTHLLNERPREVNLLLNITFRFLTPISNPLWKSLRN